jgi:hypothetical protein
MGCWSESCGISGIEIPMNNRIYALMMEKSYGGYVVSVPPILGTYDDYGGIDLTEDMPAFDLKAGENWRPVEDQRGLHMFIDADVFDHLKELEPEFTYGDRPKTLGEAWQHHSEEVVKVLTMWIKIRDSDKDPRDKAYDLLKVGSKVGRVFGYDDGTLKNVQSLFQDAITNGASLESLAPLLVAYSRAYILMRAFVELRKNPAPGSINAPQHSGEQALIPFYNFVYHLARKRRDEDRAECWDFDELDKSYPLDRWKAEVALDQTQLSFRDWQIDKEYASYEA